MKMKVELETTSNPLLWLSLDKVVKPILQRIIINLAIMIHSSSKLLNLIKQSNSIDNKKIQENQQRL
jgi:hypothetical protein